MSETTNFSWLWPGVSRQEIAISHEGFELLTYFSYVGGHLFLKLEKQPPRGVPRKRCSENMQQIYLRTPMPKCHFNKNALQLY